MTVVTYVSSGSPTADSDSAAPGSSHHEPVMSIEMSAMASAIAIPTIRTVAADLAARADFDLDSIDDLRMAVDDACAMLVEVAAEDGILRCRFTVLAERIEVVVEVDADHLVDPLPTGSFDRRVLESLVDEVNALFLPGDPVEVGRLAAVGRGRVRITLVKAASVAPPQ